MEHDLKAMLESVIHDGLKPIREDIQSLKEDVSSLKEDVFSLKEDVITILSQLDEHTQLLKALYHRQEKTDAKLESLTMDVHHMRGELELLKEGQTRQDKILESLAMRSLEQETELRALKRI